MIRLLRPATYALGVAAALLLVVATAGLSARGSFGWRVKGDRVMSVDAGGPASRAGILPGDRIPSLPPPRLGRERTIEIAREASTFTRTLEPRPENDAERARTALALALAGSFLAVAGGVLAFRRDRLVTTFGLFSFAAAAALAPRPVAPEWLASGGGRVLLDLLGAASGLALPAALVDFFARFPEGRPGRRTRALVAIGYAFAISLFMLAVLTDVGTRLSDSPPPVVAALSGGVFEGLAALFFAGAVVAALVAFVSSYRRAPAHHRPRLTVLLWSTLLGFAPIAGLTLWKNLLPGSTVPGERWAGLALVLVPLGFGYATLVQGVFDLHFRTRPSLNGRRAPGANASHASNGSHAAQAFQPGPFVSLTRVLDDAAAELVGRLGLEHCAVFAVNGNGAVLSSLHGQASSPGNGPYARGLPARLVRALEGDRHAVAIDELTARDDAESENGGSPALELAPLADAGTSLLLPLFSEDRCRAVLALGPRLSGPWFDGHERAELDEFARQASVAVENAVLHDRLLERATLERDVALARKIQQRLLPPRAPILPTVDLAGVTAPAGDIGGDYYDFLTLGPRAIGVAVADVCGKGLPAALLLAAVQAQLRSRGHDDPAPATLVGWLNDELTALEQPEKFVCLTYARLDARRRSIAWANAGLNPPLVVHADGAVEEILHGGLILGVGAGERYQAIERTFERGSLVAFYTDGVTDSLNDGEPFGAERLGAALARHRGLRAARLAERVLAESAAWHTGGPADDRTIAVIKFL
jgi:serine phosphatase RsbU (regulator of sigma subunit)